MTVAEASQGGCPEAPQEHNHAGAPQKGRMNPDPALLTLSSLLSRGRHAEAERAARSVKGGVSAGLSRAFLALRAEIAIGLGRFAAALEWAGEALRGLDPCDALARDLEGSRIRALFGLGRVREARAWVESRFAALEPAGVDLSLFRARIALHAGGLTAAQVHAAAACDRAIGARQRAKLVEALQLRARVSREMGNISDALHDLDRARSVTNGLRDASAIALVLAERADLLVHTGDWLEASRSAGQAGRIFARASSPYEHLSAGRCAGALKLAQGSPEAALPAIERAAEVARRGYGATECRAEIDLLLADAQPAGRNPEGALERATAALSFFRAAQDQGGLARAHARRSLAALSASNPGLALREARIAGAIRGVGPVAEGLADVALGRVLLRKDPGSASEAFGRAATNLGLYPPLRSVAQIGLVLSQGASPQGDAVNSHAGALEAFGDLRMVSLVRSELREIYGVEPALSATEGRAGSACEAGGHDEAPEFLPGLVGSSAPVRRLADLVRKAAPADLPAVIHGETGTGKEKVARALHDLSPRARREFVAINAATLSDELFESELFGHVRGSFTGAVADRPGLVERAKDGTLFIDEVADLSPRAQVRLLRFVELGTYRRVGETQERRAQVRIVVAANLRLSDLATSGRFRADLWQRLRGIELDVPPLSARGRDVIHLGRHFTALASSGSARLSAASEAQLSAYSWPGNVRELQFEMRRAVVLADGPLIEWRRPGVSDTGALPPLHEALRGYERTLLKEALSQGVERVETARRLGITRQALHQKLIRHGL